MHLAEGSCHCASACGLRSLALVPQTTTATASDGHSRRRCALSQAPRSTPPLWTCGPWAASWRSCSAKRCAPTIVDSVRQDTSASRFTQGEMAVYESKGSLATCVYGAAFSRTELSAQVSNTSKLQLLDRVFSSCAHRCCLTGAASWTRSTRSSSCWARPTRRSGTACPSSPPPARRVSTHPAKAVPHPDACRTLVHSLKESLTELATCVCISVQSQAHNPAAPSTSQMHASAARAAHACS